MKTENLLRGGIMMGNRVPHDFFITQGIGQSDIAIHAGSYHLALKQAGIEMCNIIAYSSILPKQATRIEKPNYLEHGSVMETIISVASSKKGQRATAGISYGWLYDKQTQEKYGGLVCEHNGNYDLDELEKKLKGSLEELYQNGFSEKYELKETVTLKESFVPEKEFGTVLVALCFTSYFFPTI